MDPLSLIVSALAAGAAAVLKDSATDAVKTAYNAVKQLLRKDKYAGVSVSGLEGKPDSDIQQAAVEESLGATNAGSDEELLQAAKTLLAAVKADDPDAGATVGVELTDLDVDNIDIHDLSVTGPGKGVDADRVRAKSVNISGIDVNATGKPDHPH